MIGKDRYDAYVSGIYVQHYRLLVRALSATRGMRRMRRILRRKRSCG